MSKKLESDSLSEALRESIELQEVPLLRVSTGSGIAYASLLRFMSGERSLRLDMADKLATYLGLSLRGSRPPAGSKQARQAARTRLLRQVSELAEKAISELEEGRYVAVGRLLLKIQTLGSV